MIVFSSAPPYLLRTPAPQEWQQSLVSVELLGCAQPSLAARVFPPHLHPHHRHLRLISLFYVTIDLSLTLLGTDALELETESSLSPTLIYLPHPPSPARSLICCISHVPYL